MEGLESILVATDFSATARKAEDHARRLAKATEARCLLIHVIEKIQGDDEELDRFYASLEERARTELSLAEQRFAEAGVRCAARAAIGSRWRTIVETAEFNSKNLITSGAADLTVLSTVEGSVITVTKQELDTSTLAISDSELTTAASQALDSINTAIVTVSNALASLGSAAKRVEIQSEFTVQLRDILKQGVGDLVDADLAEESAKLQALQIKLQLGVQALSIANAGPTSILALFQ